MADPRFYSPYKGMNLMKYYYTPEALEYWEHFTFRADDVLISAYPKSGMHWCKELVPLIMSGGDTSVVDTVRSMERCPWVGEEESIALCLEDRPSPRIMAVHYFYEAMPQSFYKVKPKVINVLRNPKDILISAFYYYGICNYHATPGTLQEFLDKFLEGHVSFGSWFDHVKGWLKAEDKTHILHLTYEEMLQDLPRAVRKMAEFLEKPLEAEVINQIVEKCLFKNIKKNNMSNYKDFLNMDQSKSEFFRKGIAGDWRNHLSEEEARRIDAMFEEKMKDVDFEFKWD